MNTTPEYQELPISIPALVLYNSALDWVESESIREWAREETNRLLFLQLAERCFQYWWQVRKPTGDIALEWPPCLFSKPQSERENQ
jgi:hypothetical protein